MKLYSHSKLSTFEQCKLKYKFRYIDKIIPEIEKSIEAHLGDSVHRAFEYFYTEIKKGKTPSLDNLLMSYIENWKENYKPGMIIVKEGKTEKDYFDLGIKFLIDYYNKHKPFKKGKIIDVEKRIMVNLHEEKNIKIVGFIDRLMENIKTGEIEIHDYKTSGSQPRKGFEDRDRQLALYSIAIKEMFGEEKPVTLVWHFLAHNKKIVSKRSDEELKQLKKETLDLIKEIESTNSFPPNKSPLCDWCQYKDICPAWNKDIDEEKVKYFKQKRLGEF